MSKVEYNSLGLELITPKGQVSIRCRMVDDETHRYVLVDGAPVYVYRRDDREAEKQTWVAIIERGLATFEQVAHSGIASRRTLQYWVKKVREGGVVALVRLPRKGGPKPTIDEAMRHKVVRLRSAKMKQTQIARECGIALRSVERILADERKKCVAEQSLLETETAKPIPQERPQILPSATDATQPVQDEQSLLEAEAAKPIPQERPQILPHATDTTQPVQDEQNTAIRRAQPEQIKETCLDDEVEATLAKDRDWDRVAARLGWIDEAEPLFASTPQFTCAGTFLAIAALAGDPCLPVASKIFGYPGPAFFGLRASIMTIFLVLTLRLKRPESLRRRESDSLGILLGLDRLPEVKTLRRKVHQLAQLDPTGEFMKEMAKARAQSAPEKPKTVLIDGHVYAYWGGRKVGQTWAPRCGRVVKGVTGNWVHLPGGRPVLCVDSPFNEGLSKVLPGVIEQACELLEIPSVTAVFDRGGHKTLLFEELMAAGHKLLTYRKHSDPVAESCFERRPTTIGNREYEYAPYERTVSLKVYEPVPPKKEGGRLSSRFTGRTISLREIRILRPDKGQTAILTNIDEEIEAAQIAPILFDRIGSQENSFKYLRSAFGLDECWTYGKEPVAEVADHPNPDFKALEKTLRRLREARDKILQEIGQALQDNPLHAIPEQTAEANKQLEKKESEIAQVQATLSQIPARKKPIEENYVQPESAPRSLVNTMRLAAWEVETLLVGLLSADYSRSDDEGRSLIAAAMHTSGSLRLAPGELIIQLAPQASPNRTRAINAVGAHLNALHVKYPGSGRVLRFEPTPVAPPPIRRNRNTV